MDRPRRSRFGSALPAGLRNRTTGELFADRVSRARTPWTRTVGYLLRGTIDAGEGLWFARCSSIHTFGMRAAIDVVFVDREQTVVGVLAPAPRNRVLHGGADAVGVIELGAGVAAAHVHIGDRLELE